MIHQWQGHYGFAKGHPKKAESELQTAMREVKEETGYTISVLPGFRTSTFYSPKPNQVKEVVWFLGTVAKGFLETDCDEVLSAKWLDTKEAFATLTYENDRELLEKAIRFLMERDNR